MISIIIPTLNEEKVIGAILENLSTLQLPHEIIVSDGKSSDKTVDIARKYTEKVIVYSGTKRQTIAEGRNDGAHVATGEFVVFMDADDYIPKPTEFFTSALSFFQKHKDVVAITTSIRVMPKLETFLDRVVFTWLNFFNLLMNNIFHFGGAGGEFQMIRRESFMNIGGFDQDLAASEDYDMFYRLAAIGKTRLIGNLTVFHSGRRAHKTGWPKLIYLWLTNGVMVFFFRRSVSKEWKEVR